MNTTILNVEHEINSQRYSAAMRSAVRFIKDGEAAGDRSARISAVEDIFATNCPTRSAEFLAEIERHI
jgi:hypothetical protein